MSALTYTAPCPRCGHDCTWSTRALGIEDTPELRIHCDCERDLP